MGRSSGTRAQLYHLSRVVKTKLALGRGTRSALEQNRLRSISLIQLPPSLSRAIILIDRHGDTELWLMKIVVRIFSTLYAVLKADLQEDPAFLTAEYLKNIWDIGELPAPSTPPVVVSKPLDRSHLMSALPVTFILSEHKEKLKESVMNRCEYCHTYDTVYKKQIRHEMDEFVGRASALAPGFFEPFHALTKGKPEWNESNFECEASVAYLAAEWKEKFAGEIGLIEKYVWHRIGG